MKTVQFYEAFDGEVFADKEECLTYEKGLIEEKDLTFYNWYQHEMILDDVIIRKQPVYYINCKNPEGVAYLQKLQEDIGWYFPSCAGLFRWDDDEEKWVTPEDDIQKLNDRWGKLLPTLVQVP